MQEVSLTPINKSDPQIPFKSLANTFAKLDGSFKDSKVAFASNTKSYSNSLISTIAKDFITKFFQLLEKDNLMWLEPRVTTHSVIGLCFEWAHNGKYLGLAIESDGSTEFVKAYGSKTTNQEWRLQTLREVEMGKQPSNVELVNIWKWLIVS